ncbi:MAG: RepB family plasmid replication initiator protein [Epsilonproteobacteria bacterium]|nr:RepB family plasmid replication initiator protein [Campylobacterota bacterium]
MEVLNTKENIFLISRLAKLVQENPDSDSYLLESIYKDDVNNLLNKITISDNLKTHWICWAKFSDMIEVGINKHIKQVLLQKFKPNSGIVKIARLKNSYSPKFFELFKTLPLKITPEALKSELGIVDKYERYYDFKKKVILPSLADLEKIDINVNLAEIKDNKKVIELLFTKGDMMSVDEMKIGDVGVIKKITATEPFRSRLFSLGIVKGEKIRLLKHTLAKNTYEIEVNKSKIALRKEEAKMIIVEKVDESN